MSHSFTATCLNGLPPPVIVVLSCGLPAISAPRVPEMTCFGDGRRSGLSLLAPAGIDDGVDSRRDFRWPLLINGMASVSEHHVPAAADCGGELGMQAGPRCAFSGRLAGGRAEPPARALRAPRSATTSASSRPLARCSANQAPTPASRTSRPWPAWGSAPSTGASPARTPSPARRCQRRPRGRSAGDTVSDVMSLAAQAPALP
jgi:hypothetical protein